MSCNVFLTSQWNGENFALKTGLGIMDIFTLVQDVPQSTMKRNSIHRKERGSSIEVQECYIPAISLN